MENNTENHFQLAIQLELVHHLKMHSHIYVPIKAPSIGDFNCFLTFINDFIRKLWISFLKHKYDAFGCFQQFKAILEKQSGYYIKSLRIDKESEYISKYFFNFRKPHGRQRNLQRVIHLNKMVLQRGRKNHCGNTAQHVGIQTIVK